MAPGIDDDRSVTDLPETLTGSFPRCDLRCGLNMLAR